MQPLSAAGGFTDTQWGQAGDIPVPRNWDGIVDLNYEMAVWRPSTGQWWVLGAPTVPVYGGLGDVPVPADYFGQGTNAAERAVYRPSTGEWFIDHPSATTTQYGTVTDVPVP